MKNVQGWFQVGSFRKIGEHLVLRAVSLAFALVSSHAILWFYNSLSDVKDADPIQKVVPLMVAGSFGLLGYFASRGLVYRMMHKESIWAYALLCVVYEFIEIVCNFAQAVSSVPQVHWLQTIPPPFHNWLAVLLYIAYSIVPVMTFIMAVVDMDLTRSAEGRSAPGTQGGWGQGGSGPRPLSRPAPGGVARGPVPSWSGSAVQPAATVVQSAPTGSGFKFPFSKKDASAQPTMVQSSAPAAAGPGVQFVQ